jgi:hypothetical protein
LGAFGHAVRLRGAATICAWCDVRLLPLRAGHAGFQYYDDGL